MWIRNLFFAAVSLGGIAALVSGPSPPQEQKWTASPQAVALERSDLSEFVDELDAVFRRDWKAHGLHPAPRADDLTVARRLSLGLTGVIPSLEEIRWLESQPEGERLDRFAARLLDDRRSSDYLAERFARAYVGVENGPFLLYRRRRFVSWLAEQLHAGRPYDELVRDLVAGDGLWTDQPQTNFMTVAYDPEMGFDEAAMVTRLSRSMLGVRLDCCQCHDYPFDDRPWTRQNFNELSAFFADVHVTVRGVRATQGTVGRLHYTPRDERQALIQLAGESGGEFRLELGGKRRVFDEIARELDGKEVVVFGRQRGASGRDAPRVIEVSDLKEVFEPAVPFDEQCLPANGDRRERLADWVTHPENEAFARATVNRVWALLFGRPLVEPLDDIPDDAGDGSPREPRTVAEEALFRLADDFAGNGFDLRRLIMAIAMCEPFQLDSKAPIDERGEVPPGRELTSEHDAHWAAFPISLLRAEQVVGAVVQASSLETIDHESSILARIARQLEQEDFIRHYGDAGAAELEPRSGTISQQLVVLNGKLVRERTREDLLRNASTRIAVLAGSDEKAIEIAYLTVLTRRPTSEELAHFSGDLPPEGRPRIRRLEDICSTLMYSTEFASNH